MSNAAKFRKKAAEFEQLKQIDRAIASYVRAIEESEAAGEDVDVAWFNKVGDLALRQGRVPDAITYYERAVEHYATAGLFNNAIALCNKILRNAPGRANVHFTLGRICARKGLRGDATRNFLQYATRMQQEGRVEEGMRALAEVADLMPELTEVQALVEEHAARAGIVLPRRRTPVRPTEVVAAEATTNERPFARNERSSDLIFLDVDYGEPRSRTPAYVPGVPTPIGVLPVTPEPDAEVIASEGLPLVDTAERVQGLLNIPLELVGEETEGTGEAEAALSSDPREVPLDPEVERPPEIGSLTVTALDGLEVLEALPVSAVSPLEGFSPDMVGDEAVETEESIGGPSADVTWLVPPALDSAMPALDDVLIEDFTDPTAASAVQAAILTETPPAVPAVPESPTHIDVFEDVVVELDFLDLEPVDTEVSGLEAPTLQPDAIGFDVLGGAVAVEEEADQREASEASEASADPSSPEVWVDRDPFIHRGRCQQAPYHLDPHDFVQSGELPPLVLADDLVEAGLLAAVAEVGASAFMATDAEACTTLMTGAEASAIPAEDGTNVSVEIGTERLTGLPSELEPSGELVPVSDATNETLPEPKAALSLDSSAGPLAQAMSEPIDAKEETDIGSLDEAAHDAAADADRLLHGTIQAGAALVDLDEQQAVLPIASDTTNELSPFPRPATGVGTLTEGAAAVRAVHVTPSLPTAAVAAEAAVVAISRRDALRVAVARMPRHWLLRRRLAEALFEAGERDAALHEMETAQQGLIGDGELSTAGDIADELVHVSPDHVPYHQKRVELAVRLQEPERLQLAYLDLADALVRMGEDGRARAVYVRVLELNPHDDRARAALGASAPPPPPPVRPDDRFVDLAEWLRDEDEPTSTRMRMREPVISGDEQADFDALLQHFKDGVARSLGDNDFEGHYDLGVAYKEMGLLDDAIAEFQKALRSQTHRLPAYEALGQCFVEQGRHQIAATVLSRALHEPGLNDEKRVGVLYLLAHSCEALQRRDEARGYFQRVYATDIQFRDVATRLATLDLATR